MIQIAGISTLNGPDHYIKEVLKIKYYIRYMDDFILIHENKEYLEYCRDKIENELGVMYLNLHPKKTKIYPLKKGIKFLGFRYKLTKSGKVIRLIDANNVKRERKKLYRLVEKSKRGEISRHDVNESYRSWKAYASVGNTFKLLQRMDKYYKELWED